MGWSGVACIIRIVRDNEKKTNTFNKHREQKYNIIHKLNTKTMTKTKQELKYDSYMAFIINDLFTLYECFHLWGNICLINIKSGLKENSYI